MYFEFILVIFDYISTLTKRVAIYEWGIPLFLGITSGVFSYLNDINLLYNVIQSAVPIITTLLGFTLAALTLFLTGNTKIEDAKKYMTEKKISGKRISLYKLIVISYSYLILIETILCIGYYIGILFPFINNIYVCVGLNTIFIVLMLNVLFSTIRSITDLYFVITRHE
jgi:hypothetical protein